MYVVCSTDDDEDQVLYYVGIDEIQLEGSSPSPSCWHVDQMPRARDMYDQHHDDHDIIPP